MIIDNRRQELVGAAEQEKDAPLPAPRDAVFAIAELVDSVHEPCALARGSKLGLLSAGMIQSISVSKAIQGGWDVRICGRTTSPACLMYLHFEREVLRRVEGWPSFRSCKFEWRFGEAVLQEGAAREVHWEHEEIEGWSVWSPILGAAAAVHVRNFR